MAIIAILGSAFAEPRLGERTLTPVTVETAHGPTVFHRFPRKDGTAAYALFRHGLPHRYLPHQIPYLAHAEALRVLGCRALLVTSSAGVLDRSVPLATPLLVGDLLMADNRLPDGRTCTLFQRPEEGQGHLVLQEGLFSSTLAEQLRRFAKGAAVPLGGPVTFAYAGGPRTKTRAENLFFSRLGAQVNSMTLGPEVVLANEAQIGTAAVVVGHKYSVGDGEPAQPLSLEASLAQAAAGITALVIRFLDEAEPVSFANRLYQFNA